MALLGLRAGENCPCLGRLRNDRDDPTRRLRGAGVIPRLQPDRRNAQLHCGVLWLHLRKPRIRCERLVCRAGRELRRAQRIHDLRIVRKNRLRGLRGVQCRTRIAEPSVIADKCKARADRLRIRDHRLVDDCPGFFGIFARHRRDVGKSEQNLLVLRIFLEHPLVALTRVVRLAFLHVDQCKATCRREVGRL